MTCYPILYSFRRCPYAMRARYALYHARVPHEHREVHLKNKPLEMLEISPKGTVPVFQLSNGEVLEQSLEIMKWAYKYSPISATAEAFIQENDTTFKYALDRYKYPGRYEEQENANYQQQCEKFLQKINDALCPFIEGENPSLGDVALFPFVRQYAMVEEEGFNKLPYSSLHQWLYYFLNSEIFERMMQKYSFWSPKDSPLLITF